MLTNSTTSPSGQEKLISNLIEKQYLTKLDLLLIVDPGDLLNHDFIVMTEEEILLKPEYTDPEILNLLTSEEAHQMLLLDKHLRLPLPTTKEQILDWDIRNELGIHFDEYFLHQYNKSRDLFDDLGDTESSDLQSPSQSMSNKSKGQAKIEAYNKNHSIQRDEYWKPYMAKMQTFIDKGMTIRSAAFAVMNQNKKMATSLLGRYNRERKKGTLNNPQNART